MKIKQDKSFKRDQHGFYSHPQAPECGDTISDLFINWWHKEHGCESSFINFDGDASEELCKQWFEVGTYDCSKWNPECNKSGSILLSIHDTEDGPVAWFVISSITPKHKCVEQS